MNQSMPDDIFDVDENTYPWTHIRFKHSIDESTREELDQLFGILDWSKSKEDYSEGLRLIDWHTLEDNQNLLTNLPRAKRFLDRLESKEFIQKVFEYYNVDYSGGYTYTVAFDLGSEDNHCGWHTDLKNKDTITLQYYISVEYPERTLRIKSEVSDEYDTEAMSGDAVMFHSNFNTWHKFNSGRGERRSIRLRLKTDLYNPKYIHHLDLEDDIGVIIDGKHMESPSAIKRLERGLSHISYLQLRKCGFNNIVSFEKMDDFNTAYQTLKNSHVKKCLIIFAGAMVGDQTKKIIKDINNTYTGNVLYDLNRVARQYVIIDLEKSADKLQNRGDYLGNIINEISHASSLDLDIAYLHPDQNTVAYLDNFHYHNLLSADDIRDCLSDEDMIKHALIMSERLARFCEKDN
jgi:uncharacterized protein YutE (UPF0331/DUF86 family)